MGDGTNSMQTLPSERGGGDFLINGNFTDVVNQRGKSVYVGGTDGYTADGWTFISATSQNSVTVEASSLLIAGDVWQFFDFKPEEYRGRTFTAAMEDGDGKTRVATLDFSQDGSWSSAVFPGTNVMVAQIGDRIGFYFPASGMRVKRLRLERGKVFTGFDAKGRGERLAECQRRQYPLGHWATFPGLLSDSVNFYFRVLEKTMRANPVLEFLSGSVSDVEVVLPNGASLAATAATCETRREGVYVKLTVPESDFQTVPAVARVRAALPMLNANF